MQCRWNGLLSLIYAALAKICHMFNLCAQYCLSICLLSYFNYNYLIKVQITVIVTVIHTIYNMQIHSVTLKKTLNKVSKTELHEPCTTA